MNLPTILTTSVIRSTEKGEAHGGLYKVDLETGHSTLLFSWDDTHIDFEGRGGERGLRGLAQYNGYIYICSCSEVIQYDMNFNQIQKFTCPYLYNLHDVWVYNDVLYITSTGYDSVVLFDLRTHQFTDAYFFRKRIPTSFFDRLLIKLLPRFKYYSKVYAATKDGGPTLKDTVHINSVSVENGRIYVSGTGLDGIFHLDTKGKYHKVFELPTKTHNGQLHPDFVIYNRTPTNKVIRLSANGEPLFTYEIPQVTPTSHTGLNEKTAVAGFNRGLVIHGDLLIVGSSPANISVFSLSKGALLKQVVVSKDIRNAIHGICIYNH